MMKKKKKRKAKSLSQGSLPLSPYILKTYFQAKKDGFDLKNVNFISKTCKKLPLLLFSIFVD